MRVNEADLGSGVGMGKTKLRTTLFRECKGLDHFADIHSNSTTDLQDNVATSNAHIKLFLDDLKQALIIDSDRLTLGNIVHEELLQVSVDET